MNARNLSRLVLAAALLGLLVAPGTAAAKVNTTQCTCTESGGTRVQDGVWTYPDGHAHLRGEVIDYQETSLCPAGDPDCLCSSTSGTNRVTMNANWEANLPPVGPMWGTGTLTTQYGGGGVWELSWHGWIDFTVNPPVCYYQGVGHGVSGSVLGLENRAVANCAVWTGSGFTTVVSTTIFQPDDE